MTDCATRHASSVEVTTREVSGRIAIVSACLDREVVLRTGMTFVFDHNIAYRSSHGVKTSRFWEATYTEKKTLCIRDGTEIEIHRLLPHQTATVSALQMSVEDQMREHRVI